VDVCPAVTLKLANNKAISPSGGLPVDVPKFVPIAILSMLRKLSATSQVPCTMTSRGTRTNSVLEPQLESTCPIEQSGGKHPLGWKRHESLELRGAVDERQQAFHNCCRIDALGLGPEIDKHAMSKDRLGQRPDVFPSHGKPPGAKCTGLAREDQELARSGTCPPIHIVLHKVGSPLPWPTRAHQIDRELYNLGSHGDVADLFL